MPASVLIKAVEAEGFGGVGMVASAFGDVQVADVFERRDDGGEDSGQVGGPQLSGETAGTRAGQVAAGARARGDRRAAAYDRSRTYWLSLEPVVLSEATDRMDRKRACGGACPALSTSS
jgi:hypothetical protein